MFFDGRFIALVTLLLVTTIHSEEVASDDELNYEMEEGVVVLTDKNFDAFLKKNPSTLVKFYAPWCGHCKHLAPEYEKASSKVSIPLAKVDATVETELGKRFEIQGYPTLKFWKDGQGPTDYDGGRDEAGIVEWVESRVDPNYKPPPEEVITLTTENFDDFISNNELVLVEFYAPWCGHCKKLAPEYEKAAQKLKAQGSKVRLGKVDATIEKDLGTKYGVSGYPTMKIIRNGRRFDYNGPREAAGIVKYMTEQSKPAATKLAKLKDIERFMSKDDVTIIGFFATEDSSAFEAFSDSAEMLREEFKTMGHTSDPAAFKKWDAKPNDIIIFYPALFHSKFEPKSRTYNKAAATSEDLLAFFREHSAPLVGKMTKKNAATRYTKKPLVVVYYNADFSVQYREGSEYWRQKVLNIAQKYQKDKYRFAVADEEEFSKELQELGLGDSGLEHNVVVFGYDGKKYPMNPEDFDGELDENLEGFMKQISSGKAKAHVKSAPAPKDDKGPVKTVVGSNFDKIVNDESKDVLIEFYAPWCGHCKSFEPKYKDLAQSLKKTQPNVVLAKMDATINDAPSQFAVEGFPTIYFAPSGKKTEPIKYSGNRDLEDLKKFMAKHGVKSFQKKDEL
uniref:Protein disulfide-isomerase A4 n=1 Tax=Caenorhabditis tropicalis TaxID=1561998 RepID=A0A1I7T947_9PELO